jgi:hypothetical protein
MNQNLKLIKLDYRSLPFSQDAVISGVYWNPIHERVEAIKVVWQLDSIIPICNVFAWVDAVVLDRDGILGFIQWERTLWGGK